ncbi:hypothetical protein ACOZWM_003282 [Cronobacter malonaticus]
MSVVMTGLTGERWRLTKNDTLTAEWEGRPSREDLPALAREACFVERDYDAAKSGPVSWYSSGSWVFEMLSDDSSAEMKEKRRG